VKITQTQEGNDITHNSNAFQFPLDVKLVLSNDKGDKIEKTNTVLVCKKITEHTFTIQSNAKIEWISIDPEFKILKKVKSIKIVGETKEFQLNDLLINQLHNGKTIIERIDAARMLKNLYSEDVLAALQNAILNDEFYGVSVEAANTIGSFYDKNNYEKSDNAYQTLKICLTNNESFNKLRSEIKRSIIKNIGIFEREESINLLEPFVCQENDEESDFVKSSAATAIGKSSKNSLSDTKKHRIVPLLKKLIETTNTFQNILATGAIDGLKELSKDNDENIVINIADFLVENTQYKKDYFIRSSATAALGKFLYIKNNKKNSRIDETNQKVFDQLLNLLKDKRRKIKINACISFADDEAKFTSKPDNRIYQAIDELIYVAEHDIDGFVRRRAETSVNVLRKWINEWSSKPPILDLKIRE
jgi:aminopeptidase N